VLKRSRWLWIGLSSGLLLGVGAVALLWQELAERAEQERARSAQRQLRAQQQAERLEAARPAPFHFDHAGYRNDMTGPGIMKVRKLPGESSTSGPLEAPRWDRRDRD
jgi:hypothetical protein